jgi:hypothetical protein
VLAALLRDTQFKQHFSASMDSLRALRKKKVKMHRMSVTSHDVLAHLPSKEGLLKKKSAAGLWQERFFVVNNRYLNYYTVENRELLGTVNLAAIDEVADPDLSGVFRLTTSATTKGGNKSEYKLKAGGYEEALQWVTTVRVRKQGIDAPTDHPEGGIQVRSKDKDAATAMIDDFLAAAPPDRQIVAEKRYKDAFQLFVLNRDLGGLLRAASSALAQLCALLTEHPGSGGEAGMPRGVNRSQLHRALPGPPASSSASSTSASASLPTTSSTASSLARPRISSSSSSIDVRRPSALPRDLEGARDLVRRMSRRGITYMNEYERRGITYMNEYELMHFYYTADATARAFLPPSSSPIHRYR